MIVRIVEEINKSLDNECYFAALALALTLPDICGKAEYPKETIKKRYVQWFDKHIGQYERSAYECEVKSQMPYLNGELVYKLRNAVLHQGTPGIDTENLHTEENKQTQFTLITQKKNDFNIYADSSSIVTDPLGNTTKRYIVNVRRLCMIISRTAYGFYKENEALFGFINYSFAEKSDGQSTANMLFMR